MGSAPPGADDDGRIYFCGSDEVPYGFMCQWYPSPFEVEGITYPTAEMWMMVGKARLFQDEDIAQQMLATQSPAEHQILGRRTKGFHRPKWDEHKVRIVTEGNYHKFVHNKKLRDWLLQTGDRELVESSAGDRIWGVGFCAKDAEANMEKWGQNLLGKVLMDVRQRVRKEAMYAPRHERC